jgi:hypothetical protein
MYSVKSYVLDCIAFMVLAPRYEGYLVALYHNYFGIYHALSLLPDQCGLVFKARLSADKVYNRGYNGLSNAPKQQPLTG